VRSQPVLWGRAAENKSREGAKRRRLPRIVRRRGEGYAVAGGTATPRDRSARVR